MLIVYNKIEKKFLDFPPVLAAEILSPATSSKDRNEKMELHQSCKVKYYLIVDPRFQKVEVYELIDAHYQAVAVNPDTYHFSFEQNCAAKVSLKDIRE